MHGHTESFWMFAGGDRIKQMGVSSLIKMQHLRGSQNTAAPRHSVYGGDSLPHRDLSLPEPPTPHTLSLMRHIYWTWVIPWDRTELSGTLGN